MSSQSPAMRWSITALQILVPIIALWDISLIAIYWILGISVIGDNIVVIAPTTPVDGRQVIGLVAAIPALVAWLGALRNLSRLLSRFRRGQMVSLASVSRLRAFAGLSLLSAVLDTATSGARRWAQGEFNGAIWTHIQISNDGLWLLFIAAAFLVISSALVEAAAYKDEAESYL